MTIFQIFRALEAASVLSTLVDARVINQAMIVRYQRYKRYRDHAEAYPNEKRNSIVVEVSIVLNVSEQTIYKDIRWMEKEITI